MDYELAIHKKPGYLHFIIRGQNNKENVRRYIEEVISECEAQDCYKILIEERLEGPRLPMMDVFEIVNETSARLAGKMRTAAYVDVNAEGDLMQFAETVAVNRMLPLKLFPTVAEAERWLKENR